MPTPWFDRLPVDKRRSTHQNDGRTKRGTTGGALQVKVFQAEHHVRTQSGLEICDITDDVRKAVVSGAIKGPASGAW